MADANGNIYAISGDNGSGGATPVGVSTVEVYNPGGNAWSTAAPIPTAPADLAAAADAKGNIYAIGGFNHFPVPLNTVERYSPPVTIYTFIKN